jgi:hypothetical protein
MAGLFLRNGVRSIQRAILEEVSRRSSAYPAQRWSSTPGVLDNSGDARGNE